MMFSKQKHTRRDKYGGLDKGEKISGENKGEKYSGAKTHGRDTDCLAKPYLTHDDTSLSVH